MRERGWRWEYRMDSKYQVKAWMGGAGAPGELKAGQCA